MEKFPEKLLKIFPKKLCKQKSEQNAFTLAEVLITLGIIGVVAAITMPTLITNHQKQSWVAGLKKVVNTIGNAIQLAVADEQASAGRDTEFYKNLVRLNSYTCSLNEATGGCMNSFDEQVLSKYLKYVKLDNTTEFKSKYKTIQGSALGFTLKKAIYLADGSIIYVDTGMGDTYDKISIADYESGAFGVGIGVDVNGEKGPNVYGRDLFYVYVHPNGYVYGMSFGGFDYYNELLSSGWKMNY